MKLIVDEPESRALADALAFNRRFVASWLLHTELHCASGRHPQEIPLAAIHAVLNTMNVVGLTRGDMLAAGTHAPLRSNDAIPLAVAIRLGTDEIATYEVSSQTLRTPPDSRSSPRRLMELLSPTEWCSVNDRVHRPCHVGRGRRTALPDRRHRRHTSKEVRT
jgi:predicted nucleic acid-binding protein